MFTLLVFVVAKTVAGICKTSDGNGSIGWMTTYWSKGVIGEETPADCTVNITLYTMLFA
jgi:hypothetical protein